MGSMASTMPSLSRGLGPAAHVVGHLGVFMRGKPHSVAAVVPDHAAGVAHRVLVDRPGDVADPVARHRLLDGKGEALAGHAHERLPPPGDGAHGQRDRGV